MNKRLCIFCYPFSTLGMVGILCACLLPLPSSLPNPIDNFDKWVHFAMFFVFSTAMWAEYIFNKHRHTTVRPRFLALFILPLLFGVVTEYLQEFLQVIDRVGDIKDLLANWAGTFVSFLLSLVYLLFHNAKVAKRHLSFLSAMQQRYTTKKYDNKGTLTKKEIDELQEILRLSPSSLNSQPWQFSIVSSSEEKATLAQYAMHNKEKVLNCSHIVVLSVYKEVDTFEKERLLDLTSQEFYINHLASQGEGVVKHWETKQLYIALGVLLSAAAQMGIDATPMEGIETSQWTQALGLTNFEVVVAVALGKGAPDDHNRISTTPKKRRGANDVWNRR